MHHFAYGPEGRMRVEGVELEQIAAAVGTPTYVYSQATIERHYRVFDAAFEGHPHLVCFAVKANTNGSVLRVLSSLGAGADIVSRGELLRALRAGFRAESIVFSGVGKTAEEMAAALAAGILAFNVESEPELQLLSEVAAGMGRVARIALRVNPDVDAQTHPYIATGLAESKFGLPIVQARRIAEVARGLPSIALHGVDCHIGSQLTSIEPFMEALESVLELVDELYADGHRIETIDLGGGLGIPYSGGQQDPPQPSELGARVVERMKGRSELIVLEPGRVIVGNAGVLLTRVLYVKRTPSRTFVIVDGAMNDLLRPTLYQAHHELLPVCQREGREVEPVDVVGPICETSDAFAKQRLLPRFEPGELIAVMSAGAYGFSMASTYNSRPRAAEVMAHEDRFHVVRTREPVADLDQHEAVAPWLTLDAER